MNAHENRRSNYSLMDNQSERSEASPIHFRFDDGGRGNSKFSGSAGDCVARAIAIAAELDYMEVYDALAAGSYSQRKSKHDRAKRKRTARNGIHVKRKWFKEYMRSLGFEWTPTMHIGSGCTTHLHPAELPAGRLVVVVSNHYTTMIDGVIRDTYDPSRGGTRCVYGYWTLAR